MVERSLSMREVRDRYPASPFFFMFLLPPFHRHVPVSFRQFFYLILFVISSAQLLRNLFAINRSHRGLKFKLITINVRKRIILSHTITNDKYQCTYI